MAEEPRLVELSPERIAVARGHLRDVLSSVAFKGSKRAQDFLQLVVEHALAGRIDSLRERMLGSEMFGRPVDYDTANDAVVRVKASEVRRRLARYYDGLNTPPTVRIALTTGSYVPQFQWAAPEAPAAPVQSAPSGDSQSDSVSILPQPSAAQHASSATASQWKWKPWLLRASVLAIYSAALISITWFAAAHFGHSHRTPNPRDPLWAAIFEDTRNTYIVPADAGFNLLEDLSHSTFPLADYLKGGYLDLPLAGVDAHSADDLRLGKYGSFVDFQIVATLAGLPEYNRQRTVIRFPRDMRLDDLKDANGILLGSVGSNPWVAIAGSSANFKIVYRQGMEGATIINSKPQSGEAASYQSHWNEPQHETFALIAFLPNLGGNGHLLLLQGLDAAGTQAAAEVLFYSPAMAPILQRATRSDGSLRYFEILVRSTSIDSSSAGTQVIATRIY
jgi:hypothetical protein